MSSLTRQLISGLTRTLQASPQATETWFVLVVDSCSKAVLGHIFSARDLLVRNVALVIGIDDRRQPIPTACAVYFCCPTPQNFSLFHAHIKAEYYNSYEFVACTGPTQLHQLAYKEFRSDVLAGKQVRRLLEYPMQLRMVCDDIYVAIGDTSDPVKAGISALYSYMSLYSRSDDVLNRVIRVPYIYTCGAKAKRLILEFFEVLQANNIRSERLSGHILLLADREADPVALFQHPYTYSGLMDDVGLFMGGDSDKKSDPAFGLGPAFQDPIFRSLASQHFTAATEEVSKTLHDLSSEYQSVSAAKGISAQILNSVDTIKTKKLSCERHTNICSKVLAHITKHNVKAYIDTEQEPPSSQRKSLMALSSAATVMRSMPLVEEEEEEHLIRTILCVLFGTQDNLDALINGLFSKVKDLLDLLSAASGVGSTDLQCMLQTYAMAIRDAGTMNKYSADQLERSGQRQAVDAFVDVALSLAKKGMDVIMGRQTTLISLLLMLNVPSTASQPRYSDYYALEAYGDAFSGAASTVGLFVVGEGKLEEANRLKMDVQQAFRENQMDAPHVTYGCTSMAKGRTSALSRLAKGKI